MQETVHDAAVERLTKLISETSPGGGSTGNNKDIQPRRPASNLHLRLEEDWFSLILVAAVVYSTVWCVQVAGWVDHLSVLSLTTLIGLIFGVVVAKQKRLPGLAVHCMAALFGLLLACWQTAGAFYGGNTAALAHGVHQWFISALAGGTGEDDSIFLFFVSTIVFVLAYSSAWLVYRTRSPWLMIVANAVVLLINLSNLDDGYIIFLVVFLMASLLLLLRFNLYEGVKRWRRQGLRYAGDLGWDVMQVGALISIGVLIFSWLLPWGYKDATASQIWNTNANPWVQLEDTWNRVISLSGGTNLVNHGDFRDTLVLGGNPNLNSDVVFTVQSGDPRQYLAAVSYDTYDGRSWSSSPTFQTPVQANETIPSDDSVMHALTQNVHVVNPPGEQDQYLFGASQIASVDQPILVRRSSNAGLAVAILAKNGKLTAGESYAITSYISSASESELRTVPMPADTPHFADKYDGQYPLNYYNPAVLRSYTQLPPKLDPNIRALALRIATGAPTMYEKALALESYLRSHYTYDANVHFPNGEEAVSWFLFRSQRRGFCNYFSTTMAVMARTLGIPARIMVGYTNGHNDNKHHQRILYGTDAHSWTQVYFAGFGWINFEPSAGFASHTRPAPGEFLSTNPISSVAGAIMPDHGTSKPDRLEGGSGVGGSFSTAATGQGGAQLSQRAGIALGSVILLVLFGLLFFSIWWQRLFRNYSTSARIYGRICLLANWAGIPLRHSQTPHEYIAALAVATPEASPTLARFEDIYARELWADPVGPEHPFTSGEVKEVPGLWKHLRPRLFRYLVRHPHFLWMLSKQAGKLLGRPRRRGRAQRDFPLDL